MFFVSIPDAICLEFLVCCISVLVYLVDVFNFNLAVGFLVCGF